MVHNLCSNLSELKHYVFQVSCVCKQHRLLPAAEDVDLCLKLYTHIRIPIMFQIKMGCLIKDLISTRLSTLVQSPMECPQGKYVIMKVAILGIFRKPTLEKLIFKHLESQGVILAMLNDMPCNDTSKSVMWYIGIWKTRIAIHMI